LAIRRAERLFGELPAVERQYLDQLLDTLEEAIALGDKPAVERCRTDLENYLDQFDSEPGDR